MKKQLAKDSVTSKCLFTKVREALDNGRYDEASDLQLEMQSKIDELADLYITYRKNLL